MIRYLGSICLFGLLFGASAGNLRLDEDNARIDLYRGGALTTDASAHNGRSVRVGRDWSVAWFMQVQRKDDVAPEPEMYYDLRVRLRGKFQLGLYGGKNSTFLARYRKFDGPPEVWREILVGRFQPDAQDYLTADGLSDGTGWIDEVVLVPHPMSDDERQFRALTGLAQLEFDGASAMQSKWSLMAGEALRLSYWMPQDSFCPAPSVTVTVHHADGSNDTRFLAPGFQELTIPADSNNPLTALSFATTGSSRTMLAVAVHNPISERFGLYEVENTFAAANTFDEVRLNETMYAVQERSRYRRDREKLTGTGPVAVIPESPMRKIFPWVIPQGRPEALDFALARRESENAQLAVIPAVDQELALHYSFAWTGDAPKGVTVDASQLGYVYLRPKAYAQLRGHTHYYPDPVLPLTDGQVICRGENLPLWITVKADAEAVAGTYTGAITLKTADWEREIPLSVRVFNFELPEKSSIRSCFFLQRPSLIDFFGITSWEEEKAQSRQLIELAAANRLTLMPMLEHVPQRIAPAWDAYLEPDGSYSFDFTRENEVTRMILDEFPGTGYNVAPSPTFGQYWGYIEVTERATGERKRLHCAVNSPEFDRIYRDFLKAAWQNAVEHGWEKYAYHYIWDEWHGDSWNLLHEKSKEAVPELPVLAVGYDTGDMTKAAFDAVDIWVPLTPAYRDDFAVERRAAGDEVWAYVCVSPKNHYNLFIDHQGFSHRALSWWFEAHDIDGMLYWGVNYWAQAAQERAEGHTWPESDWQANQFADANGDGYLMYPDAATGMIYGSQRLELLRDGLEDIEYLRLLKTRLQNGRESPSWRTRAQAVLCEAAAVATDDVASVADYDGSDKLESCRRNAALLLEEYR